jgi:hypothetical protein
MKIRLINKKSGKIWNYLFFSIEEIVKFVEKNKAGLEKQEIDFQIVFD